jgi:flagellar M-ring protein FliF
VIRRLRDFGEQFWRIFKTLPPGRRATVVGTLVLAVVGLVVLLVWANQVDFQVLYSNLSPGDASSVVERLKNQRIPFRLSQNGRTIEVAGDKVHEIRLSLAGAGLPRGGGVGFEIFNEPKLGTTQFVQRINYLRALQGELARTISAFDAVAAARVHIVMPRESLFVEEAKNPSASVFLKLKSGRRLEPEKVDAVVHLVATAVPGLSPDRITVVDTRGRLLYKKGADNELTRMSLTQISYQRGVETRLQNKIQGLMDKMFGPGRAVASVRADLDFTRQQVVRDQYDPRTVLRSEQRTTESSQGMQTRATGSPDTRFRLASRNLGLKSGSAVPMKHSRQNETSNFEVSRTRTQIVSAMGRIRSLSVAVVIDGPYQQVKGPGGKPIKRFVGLSQARLARVRELVARTMGFDPKRGDQLRVDNLPFVTPEPEKVAEGLDLEGLMRRWLKPVITVLIVVLFFLFVVRPLLKWTGKPVKIEAPSRIEAEARAKGEVPSLEAPPRPLTARDKALELAHSDPDKTMQIVRNWLRQGT